LRHPGLSARGEFQQGFGRFSRYSIRQQQEAVFGRLANIVQPLSGDAIAKEFFVGPVGE
jgi:hypothetical protein